MVDMCRAGNSECSSAAVGERHVGWMAFFECLVLLCGLSFFFSFLGFAVKIQRAERRNVGVSSQQAMNQSILGGQANCRWVLVVGILFRWLLRVGGGGAKVRSMDGDKSCRVESSRVEGWWLAYGACVVWPIRERVGDLKRCGLRGRSFLRRARKCVSSMFRGPIPKRLLIGRRRLVGVPQVGAVTRG